VDRGVHRADLATDVDAVAVRQAGVEHRHVGPKRGDAANGLERGSRLPDDLDVAIVLEEIAQAGADHLVVVEQEHPDHAVMSTPPGASRHRDFGPD
jgi:hypothetical protein